MEDCIVYLVWQLRQAGFLVLFTWPTLLSVSWKHHEGDYLANKNPIIKAMIPPEKKKKVETKPKAAAAANPARALDIDLVAGRRAIDYQPPASFLQSMDRPGPARQIKGNVLADLWS